jgi:hypothetical protein
MKFAMPVLAMVLALHTGACRESASGTSATWHLQEHSVTLSGTKASLIADCRGNNHLNWEIQDTENFKQPANVGVYCGMYSTPPSPNEFHGWGQTRTNWPETNGCV